MGVEKQRGGESPQVIFFWLWCVFSVLLAPDSPYRLQLLCLILKMIFPGHSQIMAKTRNSLERKQGLNFKMCCHTRPDGWFLEILFAQQTIDCCQCLPHEEGASWVTGVSLLYSPGEFLPLSAAEFPGSKFPLAPPCPTA